MTTHIAANNWDFVDEWAAFSQYTRYSTNRMHAAVLRHVSTCENPLDIICSSRLWFQLWLHELKELVKLMHARSDKQ